MAAHRRRTEEADAPPLPIATHLLPLSDEDQDRPLSAPPHTAEVEETLLLFREEEGSGAVEVHDNVAFLLEGGPGRADGDHGRLGTTIGIGGEVVRRFGVIGRPLVVVHDLQSELVHPS